MNIGVNKNKFNLILDHPGRVTLKTEELFSAFFVFHHRIQGREGDP